jgi:hypothetical protein
MIQADNNLRTPHKHHVISHRDRLCQLFPGAFTSDRIFQQPDLALATGVGMHRITSFQCGIALPPLSSTFEIKLCLPPNSTSLSRQLIGSLAGLNNSAAK